MFVSATSPMIHSHTLSVHKIVVTPAHEAPIVKLRHAQHPIGVPTQSLRCCERPVMDGEISDGRHCVRLLRVQHKILFENRIERTRYVTPE